VIETLSDPEAVYAELMAAPGKLQLKPLPALHFEARTDKATYLQAINNLRTHIKDGDCYEINYCVEGYCENASVEPLAVFRQLNQLSPAPFAAYYRLGEQYMMCASPERYLCRQADRVVSQPIKGTSRRHADPAADAESKRALRASIKEQAENVMIVDLVRNDMARCCATGTVQVDELFGIYSFPQVHQMISTVSGQLCRPFTDAIRYSFPMGSMTGAPKHKVMQLTERYERARRELYAGTVGYITPTGDFDFNVVIRSLFYNAATKYLSFQTGGAITYDSDPEQEWEEMRLKAWALERIFKGAGQ
jgi:para-aminobenzoate synthetase component 1